ncbi:MAG: hypothetical protein R3B84_15175 [Zavarzinella sp.]
MLDFETICREFRGLVDRRRDLITFLGTAFAAMSLFLENVFDGKLPPSLAILQQNVFAFYAFVLMFISLILALRFARLHGGMVMNGMMFAQLMTQQEFTKKGDPHRASRHNHTGVSYLQYLMVALIAAFSLFVLTSAFQVWPLFGLMASASLFLLLVGYYFWARAQAISFAWQKIRTSTCGPVDENTWRDHISESLHQSNQGLLSELAFAGLMVFSCFGAISGMGKIEASQLDVGKESVILFGPTLYAGLMLLVCVLESLMYIRLRTAIGQFSLLLDPTDRPFRLFKLTDSFLGYLILVFLACISLHVFLNTFSSLRALGQSNIMVIDGGLFVALIALQQWNLYLAGRKAGH